MFRKLRPVADPERALIKGWERLHISLPLAFLLYAGFALAVYFPVILGHRYFWEDFFIQGYPIRDYCYYSVAIKHQLPFWNPYSWAWAPLLADAQCGFWYPANLLQILVTMIALPHAANLPVLAPEASVILHMVLGAAGGFQLARKKFALSDPAALLVGLCWGFGLRMAAEQNHEMQVYQLALLPWEILLLMQSWDSWRATIGFGVLFGISFLAGQPQTYFYIALFATGLTASEMLARRFDGRPWIAPAVRLIAGGLLSAAVAAVQLLPSLELTSISARAHLTYRDANSASLTFGHLLSLFIPRIDGENPGFTMPLGGMTNDWYWHWESIFYWGCLAQLLAIYAVVQLWKRRGSGDLWTRHVTYYAWFSIFALAFGLGNHLGFNWLFWRFLPIFNQLRSPNRVVWFVWFIGSIYSGIGLTYLVRHWDSERRRKFLWRGALIFVTLNVLAALGVLDLLANHGVIRDGSFVFTLPSLISALLVLSVVYLARQALIHRSTFVLLALLLVASELWYFDFSWHRNEVGPPVSIAELQRSPQSNGQAAGIQQFAERHATDRTKLLIFERNGKHRYTNIGMHLRLPIEYANDTIGLTGINPMRLSRAFPPALDTVTRAQLMGVSMQLSDSGTLAEVPAPLPYIALYHSYKVANDDSVASHIYGDTSFDIHRTVLLEHKPCFESSDAVFADSTAVNEWNENSLTIDTRSSAPSILVVNDLYYPAWKASVDGREVRVCRAFTSLRAVEVPAGTHTVRFYYDSSTFTIGAGISIVSLSLSLVALVGLTLRARRASL